MSRGLIRRGTRALAVVLVVLIGYGTLLPWTDRPFGVYVPWLAHLVSFFLLGACIRFAFQFSESALRWTWGVLLVLAVGTEIAQIWVPIREATFKDALLNGLGAVLGVSLAQWVLNIVRKGRVGSDAGSEVLKSDVPKSDVPKSAAASIAEEIQQLTDDRLFHALPMLVRRGEVPPAVAAVGSQVLAGLSPSGNPPGFDRAVFEALDRAGVRALVMKGTLLAWTVYDEPHHRFRGDTDLLVPPEQREQAEQVLSDLGLRLGWEITAKTSHTQDQWIGEHDGRPVMIDLHWQVLNHPAFAQTFDFEALWAQRIRVEIDGFPASGLARPAALLHAALHYFVHHGEDFRPAQWLLDGDLLWREMDSREKEALAVVAEREGVGRILAAYLARVDVRFGSEIPEAFVLRLNGGAGRQWRAGILDIDRSVLRAQVFTLRALPTWRSRIRHLRRLAFPPAEYMRAKYPGASRWRIPWLYLRRSFRALIS